MVDSTDIIFDEEFWNDIENTEETYFSQIVNTDKETPLKKRKLSPEKSIGTLSSSGTSNTNINNLSNRKKRVLDLFASNDSQSFVTNIENQNAQQLSSTKKQYHTSTQKSLNSSRQESSLCILKNSEEKRFTKSELSAEQKALNKMKNLKTIMNNSSVTNKNHVNNINNNLNLKSSIIQNNKSKSPPQDMPALKRQFPGPAGLLPDTLHDSTRNLNYLHIRDINESINSTTINENRSKDFCTQDTKELFSHGAWQVMIDDLPPNYLQNYDIKSTKLSGVETVSILAGVIQKIDYNTEAPRVILKDMSDTIEGLMSRDLPIKFPNILQPGVVIIIKGANCFTFKGKNWRRNKLLMITTKSLIGIYGENSRLVTTPTLDAILNGDNVLDNNYNNKLNNEIIENFFDEDDDKNIKENESNNCTGTINSLNQNILNKRKKNLENNINKNEKLTKPDKNIKTNSDDVCDFEFNLDDFDDCDMKNPLDDSQFILTSNDKNLSDKSNQSTIKNTSLSFDKTTVESAKSTNNWSSSFADDLLLNDESDDEILSQIDVDAIAEAYNCKR